jgi:hypothetical protein
MTKSALYLALLLAAGFHEPSSLQACWKGVTTNGANPGLNTTMLCIADNGAVELKVYFPNTPIGEPPTTCTARGRRTEAQGSTLRMVTQPGQCENGNTMGQYDFRCTVDAEEIMSCAYLDPAGREIQLRLEKIFP